MKRIRASLVSLAAIAAVAAISPTAAVAGGITPSCSTDGHFSVITTDAYIIAHPTTWDFEVTSIAVDLGGGFVEVPFVVSHDGPNGTERYTTVGVVPDGSRVQVKFNLLDLIPFPDGTFYRGAFTTDVFASVSCPITTTTSSSTTSTTTSTTLPPPSDQSTTSSSTPVTQPVATTTTAASTVTIVPTVPAPTTVSPQVLPETGSGSEVPLSIVAALLVIAGSAILFQQKRTSA